MKKLFNHIRRSYEEWEDYDEKNEFDWDMPGDEEDIASEDGETVYGDEEAEGVYYAEDGETVYGDEEAEGVYYAEDGETVYGDEEAEGVYYAEDGETVYGDEESEGVYYAEDGETVYGDEEAEGVYNAEDGETVYGDGESEGVYYAEDEEAVYGDGEAEGVYYAEDGETVYGDEESEGVYYAEDGETVYGDEEAEGVYYAEDGETVYGDEESEGVYYAEDDETVYGEAEGEYYSGDDETVYADEESEYDAASGRAPARVHKNKPQNGKKNVLTVVGDVFRQMDIMERAITIAGAAVLVMALVTGGMYFSTKYTNDYRSDFIDVGSQLTGINMIGEHGLLAVADAEVARQEAAAIMEEEEQKKYDEEEYGNDVTVKLHMTSVMKDLKIKFTNKETGKLVANVPFSVTVTPPKGKSETWTDDDMDGIIYKKNITPGKYSVLVNELTGEKYKDYTVPTVEQSVEVKKDIAYDKIDVSDEVKKESEIDVSKEDTKLDDTVVESVLQDTVTWVESTMVAENYKEVSKSTIPDPATLVMSKSFVRTAQNDSKTVSGGDTKPEEPEKPEKPEKPENKAFTASVSPTSATIGIGRTASAQITAKDYTKDQKLKYNVVSDNTDIATAAVDGAGKITITGKAAGKATITATVDYAEGKSLPVKVTLTVTVLAKPTIALDKTTASVFQTETVTITATIANATADTAVTAVPDKPEVAAVSVSGKTVTVTGVAEGDAAITVKYTENGEEIKAVCAVKVKAHPKNNKTSKLKDSQGNQLYILENETYREAFYADYYTASQFFIKGTTKYTGWQTIDGNVYFFTASGEKVIGEQVIQGAKYTFASDGSLVTGSGTMGIDVSKWNGKIDWNAVKNSGVSYVIIRCGYRGSSQGMLIEDPKFNANIKGATEAGLKVGVYFFTQATDEVEAVEEASYVLDKIKNYKISYPVFLDVEASGGRGDRIDKATRTAVCKAFCETIQRGGYTAGIYANKNWLNEKIDASALNAYKIWLAQYAAAPSYKGRYDLWQYTSKGRVSGINGNVDLNLSYLGY